MSKDDLRNILERVKRDKVSLVRFQYLGNDMLPRGMVTHSDFLKEAIINGIGVSRALQSWNMLDKPAPMASWGPESSEFKIVPDIQTYAPLPYSPGTARFIGELHTNDMAISETDARYFLRRTLSRAEKRGYIPMASCETEFFILEPQGLSPHLDGKSCEVRSFDGINDFLHESIGYLKKMGIEVEHLKKEGGHAQIEMSLRYASPVKAADDVVTMREVVKQVAKSRKLVATFMPKPFDRFPGSSMHLHISLFDKKTTHRNLFFDGNDERGLSMSRAGYNFVGGLLKHMKGTCVFEAPLVNSYKRFVPGFWAPAHICYGYDHRSAAVRIPSQPPGQGAAGSQRVELRVPDASANPYLALGMAIAAGLDGIERDEDPGPPLKEDPDRLTEREKKNRGIDYMPRTLGEAIEEARADPFVIQAAGELLLSEYLKVRMSEWKEYCETVTDWEIRTYLDAM